MRRIIFTSAAGMLLVFAMITGSSAQMGMMWGSGGWGMGGAYCNMYNPGTIETLTGEVIKIERFVPGRGMHHGVQIILKTDKETIAVQLGPEWYMEKQDFKIKAKDKVTITGSRISFGGKPVIMATQVKNGDAVLKLWNENGYPLWSGHGWR